ncbi:MAG: hypothetical protein WAU47_11615, partial [Desulfobaccales bacterium]
LVEELGVARSREHMSQADLILYLVDGSKPLSKEDVQVFGELAERPVLIVMNKMDLPPKFTVEDLRPHSPQPVVAISALTGQGLTNLKEAVVDLVLGGGVQTGGEMITQARHAELLNRAQAGLDQGRELLQQADPPWELAALEVKEALLALGEITGEEVGEAVLDHIFSQFCIGK